MQSPTWQSARRRDFPVAIVVAMSLGSLLAAGFLPVTQSLVDRFAAPFLPGRAHVLAWLGCAAFPLLAWAFHVSFPRPRLPGDSAAWASIPLPVALALLYGAIEPTPGVFALHHGRETVLALGWTWIFAPLGEELLFRGWVYSVAHRFWPYRLATDTNPLPLAVWVAAIAFSLWHVQNWSVDSAGHVAFQIVYTLPVGLWLGWLRLRTGGLLAPSVAHVALNVAASLP